MLVLFGVGCLFDRATYEARLRELTDGDGVGFVQLDDCDDADASVFPEATELCNERDDDCDEAVDEGFAGLPEACDGLDQDCDGNIDEGAADARNWYNDADGDGYGLASALAVACAAPTGFVDNGNDCDDANSGRNPAAPEVPYDGVDQDCSGADLVDVDGDGYPATIVGGFDCNDEDDAVYPYAEETGENGFVDNDCDPATAGGEVGVWPDLVRAGR